MNGSFWTKRNIILLSIGVIVSAIMVGFSISLILDIDFKNLFTSLKTSLNSNNLATLWLLLLIGFSLFRAFIFVLLHYVYVKRNKVKTIKWYEWILYAFSLLFLTASTPFSIGSEPFSVYFLTKHKVNHIRHNSAFLLACSTYYELGQLLITLPSLFYVSYNIHIFYTALNQPIPYFFWLAVVGTLVDMVIASLYFVLGYSSKVHLFINRVYNKIKKVLKLKYDTYEQLLIKHKGGENFKRVYHYYMRLPWLNITALLIGLGFNFCFYSLTYISYLLVSKDPALIYFDMFNYTNISITATNFVPIPGSEGSVQYILKQFLTFNNPHQAKINDQLINEVIFIWRMFSLYLCAFVGIFGFSYFLIKDWRIFIKQIKINHKQNNTFLFKNNYRFKWNKKKNDYFQRKD
ncbi:lysylphosphatidylglycerol synthase transmembrane domain-containing protein [Ureaplasma diversum]|uniref:lysylphosphatidylglycerol synthase transmembrane domain-containing protein n=1 Tax=Ureaplasma diversum TaxID=42094 RepID=UPI000AAA3B95|nr:YbhN family protein [Ureaplasma diversum]